jgi:phenylacetate-CoA ligase
MDSLFLKNVFKHFWFRRTKLYKKTIKMLQDDEYDEQALPDTLSKAIKNVPHYANLFRNRQTLVQYAEFPILHKMDVAGKEFEFISQKYNPKFLDKRATGGTTGLSLNIYRSYADAITETAFVDYAYSLIDKREKLKIGILRGNKPKKGLFEKQFDQYVLSSYDLTPKNIDVYVDYINRNGINCLSVYPTSITIFCKILLSRYKEGNILIPPIKGIVASSEILTPETKALISEIFPNAILIDLYGQNEHVAFALSVNRGFYKFYNQYGYTEFMDKGLYCSNGNKIAEIIGTGFINSVMPFIRYATEDYVELDANGNIVSIIGRAQDFLVNMDKELVPCMMVTRGKTLENVINFQYYQDTIGELIYKVVTNGQFSFKDERMILQDIERTFNKKIIGKVEVVDHIEKTESGKQKRLIQYLDFK